MIEKVRFVHYLNQFFGGIGGEEEADIGIQTKPGPIGPGRALQNLLGDRGTVISTIICGDNTAAEDWDEIEPDVRNILIEQKPDVLIAGPAFDSGRYGIACARICMLAKSMGIKSVTGMYPDNVGVITYRKEILAASTGTNPADMQSILGRMADLALKMVRGEEIGPACQDGYVPHGIRLPVTHEKPGYERAIEMLKARVEGKPFTSEIMLSQYERIDPAEPISNLENATIAIAVSTGMVPRGNPDRLTSGHATEAFRYSIDDLPQLEINQWESSHGGFNTTTLNTVDPNYGLPLRALRRLEKEGTIKGIYPYFYSTVGNATAVNAATKIGQTIAKEFKEAGVDGVLLVAG